MPMTNPSDLQAMAAEQAQTVARDREAFQSAGARKEAAVEDEKTKGKIKYDLSKLLIPILSTVAGGFLAGPAGLAFGAGSGIYTNKMFDTYDDMNAAKLAQAKADLTKNEVLDDLARARTSQAYSTAGENVSQTTHNNIINSLLSKIKNKKTQDTVSQGQTVSFDDLPEKD